MFSLCKKLIFVPLDYICKEMSELIMTTETTITNRGTGAGGANTNATGLEFERVTDIGVIENATRLQQGELHRFMNKNGYILDENYKNSKNLAHGCKRPDDAFLFPDKKILFIIEKKCQNTSGSVAEKLQTAVFKKSFYQQIYPTVHICYIYMLSDYFKTACPIELEFLRQNGIPYYFQEDNIVTNVKKFMEDYINEYKDTN